MEYATHNRLLILLPHRFNDSLIGSVLKSKFEEEDKVKAGKFDPGKMLKRIMTTITSVQVLVFGNTSKEKAVNFCEKSLVNRIKVVNCSHTTPGCLLQVGSLYQDNCKETLAISKS